MKSHTTLVMSNCYYFMKPNTFMIVWSIQDPAINIHVSMAFSLWTNTFHCQAERWLHVKLALSRHALKHWTLNAIWTKMKLVDLILTQILVVRGIHCTCMFTVFTVLAFVSYLVLLTISHSKMSSPSVAFWCHSCVKYLNSCLILYQFLWFSRQELAGCCLRRVFLSDGGLVHL